MKHRLADGVLTVERLIYCWEQVDRLRAYAEARGKRWPTLAEEYDEHWQDEDEDADDD